MEVIELEIDPEPSSSPSPAEVAAIADEQALADAAPAIPAPLESRSRLVSAPPISLDQFEPLEAPDEGDFDQASSDPTLEVASAEISLDAIEEEEDEAPSSSRRPISLETKMSEPDDDVAPLHSPPPKSGPLLAALPNLDFAIEPSREPIAPEASDVSLVVAQASTPRAGATDAFPASGASVVRADPARADVALFLAAPQEKPALKTWGELLDEALSL